MGHQVERSRTSNPNAVYKGLGRVKGGRRGEKGIESVRKAAANAQGPETVSDSHVEPEYKSHQFFAYTVDKETGAKIGQIAFCISDVGSASVATYNDS